MSTCSTCGHASEAAFNFCPACGAKSGGSGSGGLVGRILNGKYKVVRPIGQGAMGVVYEGEHVALQKRVALKVLHPDLEVTDDSLRRFQQEGIAAGRFTHPGAIQIFDFDREGDRTLYLAMEFLDGEDLKRYLKRKGRLAPTEAVAIAHQILSVLAEAHALGIVHRDLKPDNVMVLRHSGEGVQVKVLDFGLSKLVDVPLGASMQTQVGRILGTPLYMAPEQVAGEDVDHRADLYATGLILFELLAGLTPFPDQSTTEILFSRATREAPSINDSFPDLGIPPALDAVLGRALQRRRDDRYQTAGEMLADLEAAGASGAAPARGRISRSAVRTAPLLAAPATAAAPAGRPGSPRAVAAVAGLLLAAVLGWLALKGGEATPHPPAPDGGSAAVAAPAPRVRDRGSAGLDADANAYLARIDAARRSRAAGDRDAALVHVGDAIALGLEDVEALLLRARLQLDLGRLDLARTDVERARGLTVDDPEVDSIEGWIQLEDGRLDAAEAAFVAAQEHAGAAPFASALAGRAAVALARGEAGAARDLANQAAAADGDLAVAHRILGQVELASGDPAAALTHLTRARARDGQDWRSALAMAVGYTRQGELRKAERQLVEARTANPDALQVRRLLAANYVERGLWSEARDELRDALARRPDDGPLLVLRGILLQADGSPDAAIEALEAGLDAGARNARAHALLGVLLHQRGDRLAARDHYEAARSQDDSLAEPWLDLGLLSLEAGDWRAAIGLFRGAIERDVELAMAHFALGVVLRDYLGDRLAARTAFETYLDTGGRDPRVEGWLRELGG